MVPYWKKRCWNFIKWIANFDNIPKEEQFTASNGWLFQWKKLYRVRQLSICRKKFLAQDQEQELKKFKCKFFCIIEKKNLTRDQIYNAEETGLNFQMFPKKTLVSEWESAALGYKISKKRITILICNNVTGSHKLKLVAVGKSKNPSVFTKVKNRNSLPVHYINQKNA